MKKEIPILFSTPMVQAILEGRKTMTRRVVKPQPVFDNLKVGPFMDEPQDVYCWNKKGVGNGKGTTFYAWKSNEYEFDYSIAHDCPYGKPGDILWVRESCMPYQPGRPYIYKAELTPEQLASGAFKFKPSIHMPKAAARIWLEVSGVRVERLHEISREDIYAEGAMSKQAIEQASNPFTIFSELWHKINGEENWNANPWVWVVSFKVLSTTGNPQNS